MEKTIIGRVEVAEQFVRLGYGDLIDDDAKFRSLDFLTERLTTDEIKLVISVVPSHDAFDAKTICSALDQFRGRVAGWRFGRAGSPLLMVDFAHWTHQLEDTPSRPSGTRISEQDRDSLISELRNLFLHQLGADKFESDDVELSCGAWWD
ncbi:hypothetical protein [Duganella sacchari]|uniref:hypothetical protein n=1 Tax=Duganella sacchari TaxID=551987 RepID=UPI001114E74C|nr:hypothetical protein [Duganella sacchari]